MAKKTFNAAVTARAALPRSQRTRGTATSGATASSVVIIGGGGGATNRDTHTHPNLPALNAIGIEQGYINITTLAENENGEVNPATEKVKAGYADRAAEAEHADNADTTAEAEHAGSAATLDPDSPVRDEFLSRIKDDNTPYKITVGEIAAPKGKFDDLRGDSLRYTEAEIKDLITELLTSDSITTENLTVTKLAHFYELDRVKSAGGALLLTPANGFTVYSVERTEDGYKLRYLANDGDRKLSNDWKAGDQAICQTFNAAVGTSYNTSNKYYWALVTAAGTETVDGDDYHYIVISATDKDGEVNPEPGDEIAMLGYRGSDDPERQSAIYISAYNSLDTGITAPLMAHYKGVNDFDLPTHRHTWIAANGSVFRGSLRVEDAMAKANGYADLAELKAFIAEQDPTMTVPKWLRVDDWDSPLRMPLNLN